MKEMPLPETTPRCVVRFLEERDYPTFVKGYADSLPAKNRFDEGYLDTGFMTTDWYAAMLDRRRREAEDDFCYMFHVFRRETGQAIGYGNIRMLYRGEIQCGEIGYTVFNNYWNQGYATEIVEALTRIGFETLGFHRLEAYINLDNPASQAVARKCGYTLEGIREKYLLEDGVWTDNAVYYRINPVWKPDRSCCGEKE